MTHCRARTLTTLLLCGLLFVAGCGTQRTATPGTLQVVATTTQVADLARTVAGGRAEVVQLLQPGTDAHEYEPTSSDLAAIAAADLVLANGAGLDSWIDKLHDSSGSTARVVQTSQGIAIRRGVDGADPHVWMDPTRAAQMVVTIGEAFATADSQNAQGYRDRASSLRATLGELDRELASKIAQVPPSRRTIVTDHDAFGYFTDRYGITVIGTIIPSVSSEAEPSSRDVTALATRIREGEATAVFAESGLDPTIARALARESGVALGATLYADSLGPAGSPAATYIAMMRHNMRALVDGMR